MTTSSESRRIAAAFFAGWMSATVFAAVASREVPAIDAIIAAAVMMALFLVSGFAYNRFIAKGRAEGQAATFAEEGSPVQGPAAPTREERCAAYAEKHALTPRQGEICLLIVEGKSVVDIAEELYISKDTVKTHVKALYAKTGTHSRQELVAAVYGHQE